MSEGVVETPQAEQHTETSRQHALQLPAAGTAKRDDRHTRRAGVTVEWGEAGTECVAIVPRVASVSGRTRMYASSAAQNKMHSQIVDRRTRRISSRLRRWSRVPAGARCPLCGARGDARPQLAADVELLARQCARDDADVERVDLDALDTHDGGRVEQQRPQRSSA